MILFTYYSVDLSKPKINIPGLNCLTSTKAFLVVFNIRTATLKTVNNQVNSFGRKSVGIYKNLAIS